VFGAGTLKHYGPGQSGPRQLRGQVEENLRQSKVTAEHRAEALAIAPVVCVQNAYGIGLPAAERESLRACGEQGVAYVPFFAEATPR
jgi:aryl-alcohol dehydrogenase-like predicted oxidoreductase